MVVKHEGRDWGFSLGMAAAALVPRLYVALALSREPVWDGHYYDFGAKRIAAGLGYSDDIVVNGVTTWHPWCHYPVGYSGFLGALYKVFGAGQLTAPVANAVIGAVMVLVVHRIARHMLSTWRARVAGLLTAAHPGLILYSALVMTELLAALVPLLSLWIALLLRRRSPLLGAVAAGCMMGLATLVQPKAILLAPILGLALVEVPSTRVIRSMLARGALATLFSLVVVAPWTLRNCRVMDGCAFVSTNGGWNLAIGAFPRATGRFETLRASDGCAVVTGQVQQDRCWAQVALQHVRNEPGRWLRLAPAKLSHSFDHESYPVEYLREADPDAWPEERRARWRQGLTLAHGVLLSVAAFGLIALGGERRRDLVVETLLATAAAALIGFTWGSDRNAFYLLALSIPLLGWIPRAGAPFRGPVGATIVATFALFMVTHVAFFGEDRYHMQLVPLLCVLAAGALRGPESMRPPSA